MTNNIKYFTWTKREFDDGEQLPTTTSAKKCYKFEEIENFTCIEIQFHRKSDIRRELQRRDHWETSASPHYKQKNCRLKLLLVEG